MSLQDQVCELNKQTGEVFLNGELILLRPKTFELLLFLASNPSAVHSKAEILASVWPGAVVEDQVIFQSINEIRKELGTSEAIKTFPRRGYKLEISISIIDIEETKHCATEKLVTRKINFRTVTFVIVALIAFSVSIALFLNNKNNQLLEPQKADNQQIAHKGILVLPFNVSSLDESQQWLRYGAMEGLIKRISPNKDITVFHLEDAIEILNRNPLDERENIDKIFEKSGAFYILQTSLSGQPGELNVIYNIYSRTNRTTKTIQATSLEHLLTSLVDIFEETIGSRFNPEGTTFDQQLQNDLIAKAMQFLEADDLESALSFVQSAVINDPDNIIASYLLVKTHMELSNIHQGLEAVDEILKSRDKKSLGEYEHRLLYFKGAGLAALGELTQAENSLLESKKLSKHNKDWLYYAYNQSILGKIKLSQKQPQLAYRLFHSALEYQELLNCPMGIAQGYLDFSDYYLNTGEASLAQQSFLKAQTLVQAKNLKQIFPLLSAMSERLKQAHN